MIEALLFELIPIVLFDLIKYYLDRFWAFGGRRRKKEHFGRLKPIFNKISIFVNLDLRDFLLKMNLYATCYLFTYVRDDGHIRILRSGETSWEVEGIVWRESTWGVEVIGCESMPYSSFNSSCWSQFILRWVIFGSGRSHSLFDCLHCSYDVLDSLQVRDPGADIFWSLILVLKIKNSGQVQIEALNGHTSRFSGPVHSKALPFQIRRIQGQPSQA